MAVRRRPAQGAPGQHFLRSSRLAAELVHAAGVVRGDLVVDVGAGSGILTRALAETGAEDAAHQHWLGQMALSVVWALYAGVLAAVGFIRRAAPLRWASLALFALTVIKAMLIDVAELQRFYRIVVLFVLGVLLLLVAWAYHKAFHSRDEPQEGTKGTKTEPSA